MIRVGIIGGASQSAGELIRILINHPDVEIIFVHSKSHPEQAVCQVHAGLYGECDLTFTKEIPLDTIDMLFCCTFSEDSFDLIKNNHLRDSLKIIDFSNKYRINSEEHSFIYGLPELNRRAICHGKHVANPGSVATCVELGLLPLAKHLMLNSDIPTHVMIGSTEAESYSSTTNHFSNKENNLCVSQPFIHSGAKEIKQVLQQLQNSFQWEIDLIPYHANFTRGIFASMLIKTKVGLPEFIQLYKEYYAADSFTHLVEENIELKQVINTNKCLLHLEKNGDKLLIVSCIDNLLKGGSGQAVHNMNLLFGLEETVGLKLKPSVF